MKKLHKDKQVLKQDSLSDEEIDRLENYPKAEKVNLAALIAERRQQAEKSPKSSPTRKPTLA